MKSVNKQDLIKVKKLQAKLLYRGVFDVTKFYDVAGIDFQFKTISLYIDDNKDDIYRSVINIPLVNCLELKFKNESLFDDE
ncbi:hypothetical protein LMG7974_00219 [Campylobacter majalis]|uniref:Uncharacterized protein n=1 Tax=Campylobacter majalis TaxID=2790656 RepID=A0ABM8Q3A9_9BACT|nr:hypothetical protein [Campylobacter majalis]CAD7287287.1 hypothetical protein LMG7974_00219 [Campylobacter majalis]